MTDNKVRHKAGAICKQLNFDKMKKYNLLFLCSLVLGFFSCNSRNETDTVIKSTKTSYEWEKSIPVNEGLDNKRIAEVIELAKEYDFIKALAVSKNGKLVVEEYFNSYTSDNAFFIASATKGFVSAATGIAITKGYIDSTDQKIIDYFPDLVSSINDERKKEITIEQLLQMRAGFGFGEKYPGQDDLIKFFLTKVRLKSSPGTKWAYNGSSTHLISSIITKQTGKSTLDFVQQEICNPLDINIAKWETDLSGINFGGGGMYLTVPDALRFGQLYLKSGNINGVQILDSTWIEKSLTSYSTFEDFLTKEMRYGYLWWIDYVDKRFTYHSAGYGGQFIVNIPDTDMTIVVIANNRERRKQAEENMIKLYSLVKEIIKSSEPIDN